MSFLFIVVLFSVCVYSTANITTTYQVSEWHIEYLEHEQNCDDLPFVYINVLDGFQNGKKDVSTPFLQYLTVWSTMKSLEKNYVLYISAYYVKNFASIFYNGNIVPREIIFGCPKTKFVHWDKYNFASEDINDYRTFFDNMKSELGNIIINSTKIFYLPIADHISEIKSEFKLQRDIISMLNSMIGRYKEEFYSANPNFDGNVTFVGVRVKRRTERKTAPREYFLEAMEEFRARSDELGTPIFFIMSDEPTWADYNLMSEQGDGFVVVIFPSKDIYEVSFLSLCNHTIIDSIDEVAVLGSVLGAGSVIATDTDQSVVEGFAKLPNWGFKSTDIEVSE